MKNAEPHADVIARCDRLKSMLAERPFVIAPERMDELAASRGEARDTLLIALAWMARDYARAPISEYRVGAAAQGPSGQVYLGTNLEFSGNALNQTVHAEQFVVTLARHFSEPSLTVLAVSASPCGHCRQWLYEIADGEKLRILTPWHASRTLRALLPQPTTPQDLGARGALLATQTSRLTLLDAHGGPDPQLVEEALQAAQTAYAPYSRSPSGVAVRLRDGHVFRGAYLENAAFNTSLSPLQGALVGMVSEGRGYDEIASAALVEVAGALVSQGAATRSLLDSVQPNARLFVVGCCGS